MIDDIDDITFPVPRYPQLQLLWTAKLVSRNDYDVYEYSKTFSFVITIVKVNVLVDSSVWRA